MSKSICVIGDSITGGVIYLSDSARYVRCQESFVNLLGSELKIDLRNHSKFGCTVGSALRKMERYTEDIAGCPDTLVMLGGNDSDFNWPQVAETPDVWHDCNTPMETFKACYNRVLDRIIELGSRPVLINLIPVYGRRYFNWFSRKADPNALMKFLGSTESIEHWNEMYNLAVMSIANMRSLPVLDVRSAFLSARTFDGLYSEDGIHPNAKGHRRMFEHILPQAKTALI